jgi:tetratricopeptide (TPR) repeat protein
LPPDRIIGINRAADVLQIATEVLSGEIAATEGQTEAALQHFQEAVRIQDGLRYYEPPNWYYPVRESVGRLLLSLGRTKEAEAVFREDLRRTPHNPWSLYGLMQSLRAQKADSEPAKVEGEFRQAWSKADLEFQPSRFEAFPVSDAR